MVLYKKINIATVYVVANGEALPFYISKGKRNMGWYAIFVETGMEERVCAEIKQRLRLLNCMSECELLIPRRKLIERHQGIVKEVITKMFPGYILIYTEKIQELYGKVRGCRHLIKFIHTNDYFAEIKVNEIANIVYMMDDSGIIGPSDIYIENDRVRVISGPLKSYDGYIKKIDKRKHRAKVIFQFNGIDHAIDLSINVIERINMDAFQKEIFFVNSQ